eukprot:g11528.t1 g11528   contig6:4959-5528(-)
MLVLEANQQVWNTKLSYHKTPLVWDTGASNGLTPFKSDFLDYMEVDIPVKDISKVNRVVGIGTTMYRFVDSVGETIYIPCLSYHLPSAEIRLFSPRTYHQRFGGSSIVHGDGVTMHLNTGEEPPVSVIVPIDPLSNLPVVAKCAVTETEKFCNPFVKGSALWVVDTMEFLEISKHSFVITGPLFVVNVL